MLYFIYLFSEVRIFRKQYKSTFSEETNGNFSFLLKSMLEKWTCILIRLFIIRVVFRH